MSLCVRLCVRYCFNYLSKCLCSKIVCITPNHLKTNDFIAVFFYNLGIQWQISSKNCEQARIAFECRPHSTITFWLKHEFLKHIRSVSNEWFGNCWQCALCIVHCLSFIRFCSLFLFLSFYFHSQPNAHLKFAHWIPICAYDFCINW